jgi:hypothetical protein
MSAGDVLSRLDILLTANSAQYRQDMQQAADESVSNFDRIRNGAKNMAAGIAAAFSVGMAVDWVNSQVDAAIAMDNLAKTAGITTTQLQTWSSAAASVGIEGDKVTDAMSGLNEKLLDAATGGKDAAQFFDVLGVSVTDASGRVKSADAAMQDIATAFAGMADGATKSAIASELMGDAGAELIPILNQGGASLAAAAADAERLGMVLDQQTIVAMRQFKTDTAATSTIIDVAKSKILVGMMPALTAMSGGLKQVASDGTTFNAVGQTINFVLKGVAIGAAAVGAVFNYVGDRIGKFAAMAAAVATGDFKGAWAIFNDGSAYDSAVESVSAAMTRMSDIYNATGATAASTAASVVKSNADIAFSNKMAALNADPEKNKKEKKDKKPAAEKDGFDYAAANNLKNDFADWSADQDRIALNYTTDTYLELKKNVQSIYDTMRDDKALLTTDLTSFDLQHVNAARDAINEQSLFERLIFKSDNAQKIADADLADKQQQTRAESRLTSFQAELEQKRLIVNQALEQGLMTDDEAYKARERLQGDYLQKSQSAETADAIHKRQTWASTQSFFAAGLDALAQGQGKAAKVAREINKARALWQIAQDTRSAAMGAYSALAGIPIIGPALGVAAAGAAIGFGVMQAKAVMSDSPATGGGGGGAISAPSITPVAAQPQNQPVEPVRTSVYIPPDTLFTGRQMVDLLNEALADGKRINGSITFST